MADSQITLHQLLNTRRCLLRVLKQGVKQRSKQGVKEGEGQSANQSALHDHVVETRSDFLADQLKHFRPIIADQQKHSVLSAFIDHILSLYPEIDIVKNYTLDCQSAKEALFLNLGFISSSINVQLDAALCDENNQWHLFLVKSGTGVKKNDLLEAAFILILFEQLGFSVKQFSVCIVKRKHIDEPKNCIELVPIIDELREDQNRFDEELITLQEEFITNYNQSFDLIRPNLTKACFKPSRCQYFNDCWPKVTDHSIFTISHLHPDRKQELVSDGVVDINDITELDSFTPKQQRYIELVQNQSADIDWQSIEERLSHLTWPIYFLDFEADNPSIPSYPNTPTFAKIVFQYSCHKVNSFDDLISGNIEHSHYVDTGNNDPRLSVVEHLRQSIAEEGSIIVWHADFERSRLLEMAELLPDHTEALTSYANRLWDLELVFIHDFEDYRANGSKSLKNIYPMIQHRAKDSLEVLPEGHEESQLLKQALNRIISGVDYSGLDINDGEQVIAAWYLLKSLGDDEKKAKLIQLMQRYCQLDTLALADILLYLYIQLNSRSSYEARSNSEPEPAPD